ncbi:hypothetical protein HDU81_011081 [Chytriomyces hyalinus]|nr:hypothetical protein HDU81_011081 [Chytriomyces hyalinus]
MNTTPKLKLDFTPQLPTPASSIPEQDSAIQALHAAIPDLVKEVDTATDKEQATLVAWANQPVIVRQFLRATSWDLGAAKKRLVATMKWRNEYKPDQITAEEVEPEAITGKQFISGFDQTGRPQLFLVPRNENTKTYDRQIRFSVYMLEKCIKLMPDGVEKVAVIIDYENLSLFNATPLSVSMKYMAVLSNHYPERLGVAVMVNASWYFSGFFKLLSPFLDPVTKSKLQFTKVNRTALAATSDDTASSKSEKPATEEGTGGWTNILDISNADQLPIEFGGSHPFTYKHDVFWAEINGI